MLPRGYTRVEYIESTGTQYIDTGVKPSNNTRVVMDFETVSSSSYPTPFGAWNASNNGAFIFLLFSDLASSRLFYGSMTIDISHAFSGRRAFEADANVWKVDGQTIHTFATQSFQTNYNLFIFGYNSAGNVGNLTSGRAYGGQIYEGQTAARNYVPYIDATGDASLWDEITSSSATKVGTFVHGAAIVPAALSGLEQIASEQSITLQWDASEDANEYVIARDGVQIGAVYGDVLSYTDAKAAGEHVYTITPYNGTQAGEAESITAYAPPDSPSKVSADVTENVVNITWEVVAGAGGYYVYRDGNRVANTFDTAYTDVLDPPEAIVYTIVAYAGSAMSDPSVPVRAESWGDIPPELIFDRTLADVNDAKTLINKYRSGVPLTEAERAAWNVGLRGCYNTSDVNRVEYHTRELQSILNANGYNINIATSLWAKSDIMRYSDIVRYLGNIETILDMFGRSANAPPLPTIGEWIDYIAANNIEKILYLTRELIFGALAMFRRAGTFTAGNYYVSQVIRRA